MPGYRISHRLTACGHFDKNSRLPDSTNLEPPDSEFSKQVDRIGVKYQPVSPVYRDKAAPEADQLGLACRRGQTRAFPLGSV